MVAVKKPAAVVVAAPLVQVVLGSRAVQFYRGDVLPEGVSSESIKHLKSLGYVTDGDAPAGSDEK